MGIHILALWGFGRVTSPLEASLFLSVDGVSFLESEHTYNLLLTVPWTHPGTGEGKTNPYLVWIAWSLWLRDIQAAREQRGSQVTGDELRDVWMGPLWGRWVLREVCEAGKGGEVAQDPVPAKRIGLRGWGYIVHVSLLRGISKAYTTFLRLYSLKAPLSFSFWLYLGITDKENILYI